MQNKGDVQSATVLNGKDGAPGKDGVGIQSVTQTTTSTEDGGVNVVTVTKTDGTTSTFEVRNGGGGTTDHSKLANLDAADQHPMSAITGLEKALEGKQPVGNYLKEESDPTVPAWAKAPAKPGYTASEVGADPSGTADSKVAAHNTWADAHSDIRLLIQGLSERLSAVADSDDDTLDQLSEIVAYIKSNKSLIDAITTSKVNASDIVDNLTTNVANKPLSAAQGVALKALIDAIVVPTVDNTLSAAGKAADAAEVGNRLRALSEEIADLSTLTLGVHTDGLVYIFLNGVPVGTGVKIDGSIVVDGDTVELSDGITLTTLMFSDDFDGGSLGGTWKPAYGHDNAALSNWWSAGEENLGVADSCLRLTMLRNNPNSSYEISGAKVETMQHETSDNYGFDTGYCEVKFKLDKVGSGIWPAIWCVGQTQTDSYSNITADSVTRTVHGRGWPWAGEIDQMDAMGVSFGPGLIYQTDPYVSSIQTSKSEGIGEGVIGQTLEADTWYTIGVLKTKEQIKVYFNRNLIGTFNIADNECFSSMGEKLIINLSTGSLAGTLPEDVNEVNMYVDYVKVYSLTDSYTTLAEQNVATLLPDYAEGFACVAGRSFLLYPQFAENTQNTALYWASSNTAVAKVVNGYVTTVANGECTISATDTDGNKVISFLMTVKADAGVLATKLNLVSNTTSLGMGETVEIDAHIYPTSCDSLTPVLTFVSGSEYCTIDGLTITNTNQSGANQNVVIRVSTNNPEVYEDITLQMIGYIADTIDTNGIVAKYTRKGWSADAWTSDLETNPAVAATNNDANGWTYTAGLGYKKAYNFGSVATIGTDLFNIDGPFTLVSRMHYEPGASISSGGNAFEVINSDDSGAGNIEPNVGQNRLYTKDATATNRQIGSFFGDTSRDTTDGATYNVVLVKDESRNLTVYINGVQTAQSTYYSTVDPMGLTGMVFRFPKGSVYTAYYQAMLAYNRAMTAEEIVALHEALEEMYA